MVCFLHLYHKHQFISATVAHNKAISHIYYITTFCENLEFPLQFFLFSENMYFIIHINYILKNLRIFYQTASHQHKLYHASRFEFLYKYFSAMYQNLIIQHALRGKNTFFFSQQNLIFVLLRKLLHLSLSFHDNTANLCLLKLPNQNFDKLKKYQLCKNTFYLTELITEPCVYEYKRNQLRISVFLGCSFNKMMSFMSDLSNIKLIIKQYWGNIVFHVFIYIFISKYIKYQ